LNATLVARKKAHEDKLAELTTQAKGLEGAFAVREMYAPLLDQGAQRGALTDEERKYRLSALMPDLIKTTQYPIGDVEALTALLLRLYARCDVSAFLSDILEMPSANECDPPAVAAAMQRERELNARTEREIERAWEDAGELFTSVPLVWGDDAPRQVREDEHKAVRRRNSRRIIEKFVSIWQERGPLFPSPVTVTGILISSLPREQRETWQKAYDRLKLGDFGKRLYFMPIIFEDRSPKPATEPDAPQSIFGKMLTAVRGVQPTVTGA
jgi:hypothetical protein